MNEPDKGVVDAVKDGLRTAKGEGHRAFRAAHVQVYIQSTLKCSRAICEQMLDKVRMPNAKQSYANDKAVPFIDISRTATSAEDGLLKQYTIDRVHLSGSGYANGVRRLGLTSQISQTR
jgi:hypothetical protein